MTREWKTYKLKDALYINPYVSLRKGTIAKKVSMDKLQTNNRYIPSYELAEYSGGAKFANGDTIMARITPCLENGKIAQVSILDDGEVGFGSTEYIVFRAKEGITDRDFVYSLISSSIIREPAIKSMVGSSNRQRVQPDVVGNLEIAFPPLDEQIKIAKLLRTLDDKIESNKRVNDILQQQAQAIFDEWFTKQTDSFIKVSLSTLMDYCGGSQPPASEFVTENKEGYIRFVQIRDYETDGHITYIPISRKNKICDECDIMIARYGASLGRICFGLNGAYNVALAKVIPAKWYYREFLRCYLSSRDFYEGINYRGGRSAQAGFNEGDIHSFVIPFPCNDDMVRDFEHCAAPMFQKRLANLKENQRLAALRDTLLPKLMRGEIDVSNVQI